jgi:hypothetical protein
LIKLVVVVVPALITTPPPDELAPIYCSPKDVIAPLLDMSALSWITDPGLAMGEREKS